MASKARAQGQAQAEEPCSWNDLPLEIKQKIVEHIIPIHRWGNEDPYRSDDRRLMVLTEISHAFGQNVCQQPLENAARESLALRKHERDILIEVYDSTAKMQQSWAAMDKRPTLWAPIKQLAVYSEPLKRLSDLATGRQSLEPRDQVMETHCVRGA